MPPRKSRKRAASSDVESNHETKIIKRSKTIKKTKAETENHNDGKNILISLILIKFIIV